MKRLAFTLIVLTSTLFSCRETESTPEEQDFDRSSLLSNYAENIIKPKYLSYQQATQNLQVANDSFQLNQNASNLTILHNAWWNCIKAWQEVSVFEFGPASNIAFRGNTNLYPVDTTLVQSNIAGDSYDLQQPSNYAAKGLQGLDYILFGIASDHTQRVAYYQDATLGANRRNYLNNLVNEIAANSTTIYNQWVNNYSSSFVSSSGTDVGSSIGQMYNAYTLYFEQFLRDGKIGIPSGARTFSQTPLPHNVEAKYYNVGSMELAIHAVKSMKEIFRGDYGTHSGLGWDDYLDAVEATYNGGTLNGAIQNQFDVVITKLENLNEPLTNEVVSNQQDVIAVFSEMQKLIVMLKVDVPANLGILITYADSDGD